MADDRGGERPARRPRKAGLPPAGAARARKRAAQATDEVDGPDASAPGARSRAPGARSGGAAKRVSVKKAVAKKAPAKKAVVKKAVVKKAVVKKAVVKKAVVKKAAVKKAAVKKAAVKKAAVKKAAVRKAAVKKAAVKKAAVKKVAARRAAPVGDAPVEEALVDPPPATAHVEEGPPSPPPPPPPPSPPEPAPSPPAGVAAVEAPEAPPEGPARPPTPVPAGPRATRALVLAVVALLLCFTILVPVVALVVALGARRRGLRLATAAVVLSLLALAGGVAVAASVLADRFGPSGVKYTELRPGDCLEQPEDRFVRVERVDCAEPHDLEVFALVTDPAPRGARYPGPEILEREATVACLPQFQAYVGIPYEQSELRFTRYVPTESNWEEHNRLLICTLSARTGQLTGSVKDSRR